jgi:hypothetical protein
MYKVTYGTSRALIIGINDYSHASPLGYAVQDAEGVAETLISDLSFSSEFVQVLLNEEATKSNILRAYMSLCQDGTNENDRLIVFFAGHGYTERARRGEVGFLVPFDGNTSDLSTLIRWDELTRNADLIQAKHILFLMDACYGGLAITRSLPLGSMRFMRDMMQRLSRQVLTAGKADELVADSGGPLPDHSVFTGHLINGLKGAAADPHGILTASGITAYVYQCVRSDDHSNQTPHFGHLTGDGDMILLPAQTEPSEVENSQGSDTLFAIPAVVDQKVEQTMSEIERLKTLLSESKHKIGLYDQISQQTRQAVSITSDRSFLPQGQVTPIGFAERIAKYEEAVDLLLKFEILIGFWGSEEHGDSLVLPIKRLSERIRMAAGNSLLLSFRWYPVALLVYGAGLGSLAALKYANFLRIMQIAVPEQWSQSVSVLPRGLTPSMIQTYDAFKMLEGYKDRYVPFSEYAYKFFQPLCDDLLFTGTEYEALFDKFEVFYALQYAHEENPGTIAANQEIWGPIGRYGWKGRHYGNGPLKQVIIEAQREGSEWAPLKAGLFGGSWERFERLATGLQEFINKLHWF